MTWTIGRKLYVGVGTLLGALAAVSFVGVRALERLDASADHAMSTTVKNLEDGSHLEFLVADLRASAGLVIIAAARQDGPVVKKEVQAIDEMTKEFLQTATTLEKSTQSERVKALVRQARAEMTEWAEGVHEVGQLAEQFKAEEAAARYQSVREHGDKALEEAEQIFDEETALMEAEKKHTEEIYTSAHVWMLSLVGLSALVGAFVFYTVRGTTRTLTRTTIVLREGAEQVVAAAAQVAGSAQQLSEGATEQAASLEETSASMEEISSMTKQNASNSQNAAALIVDASTLVSDSNRALTEMQHSMATIRDSSHKIANIIKTIDAIAFQTNILALNAAVEAARAGEAGMGFAVVADEVRNLAQRSAQAAKDTAALIEEAIVNSQEGNQKVEQVARSIGAVTETVGKAKQLVEEVHVASIQQADGVGQVAQAVAQMEKVTQNTAANAEESAAASEELSAQAETTMVEIERLEAMVTGASAGSRQRRVLAEPAARPTPAARTRMALVPAKAIRTPRSNEEALPLGDGTFGTF